MSFVTFAPAQCIQHIRGMYQRVIPSLFDHCSNVGWKDKITYPMPVAWARSQRMLYISGMHQGRKRCTCGRTWALTQTKYKSGLMMLEPLVLQHFPKILLLEQVGLQHFPKLLLLEPLVLQCFQT